MQMSMVLWHLHLFAAASAGRTWSPRPTLDEFNANQEASADAATEQAAHQSKMAAVDKVLAMMEDLRSQVADEGEKEAHMYNNFACWCKATITETSERISDEKHRMQTLQTAMEELDTRRSNMDAQIEECQQKLAEDTRESTHLQERRQGELEQFKKDSADLSSAIAAIEEAVNALKASKTPNFLQVVAPMKEDIQKASLLAEAMMLSKAGQVAALLQTPPDVPIHDYTFKSDGVIGTLETLLAEFRKKKDAVDKEEVERVSAHTKAQQALADSIRSTEKELDESQKAHATASESKADKAGQFSTENSNLMQDNKFLAQTSQDCRDKATTWDQRKTLRAAELSTLSQVIDIVATQVKTNTSSSTARLMQRGAVVQLAESTAGSPPAMEALEAAVEESEASSPAPVLVQIRNLRATPAIDVHVSDMAREAVVRLLRAQGSKLRSAVLTSVANRIHGSADPFAKIKLLIQELIDRLLAEASNESNQKGWCDKATADSTQHRDLAAAEVEKLNAAMMSGEADVAKMKEILDALSTEIGTLENAYSEAAEMRAEENEENEATVDEADAGLKALNQAIQILDRFYKTAAKEKAMLGQISAEPQPDAGFDNFETYSGSQSESGGIIGLMEVMRSDFERTISETKEEEDRSSREFLEFATETNATLAEKKTVKTATQKDLRGTQEKYGEDEKSLGSQMELLSTALKELLELKTTCVDTGMSYEERVRLREEEIAALKKGLCILEHSALGADAVEEC